MYIFHLSIYDYIVIILFFVITCLIGIYYAWKDRHTLKSDNAFVGDKRFKIIPIACSLLATQISAIFILGLPAEFYTRGIQYWVYMIGHWMGVLVALYLFLPVFFHVNSPSSFTYVHERFKSKVLRGYCALTFVVSQILYSSVVLYAPCLAISLMVPISLNHLILIVGGICAFYTAIGGIKTVIFTDLFQFFVIFSSITALLIKGWIDVGGIGRVFETAHNLGHMKSTFDFHPNPTRYQTVWSITLGIFFLTVRSYGVYQPSVQRFVSMPSLKQARKSLFLILPMQLLMFTILSTLGFVMLASFRNCDPLGNGIITKKDHLLSLFAANTFSPYKGLQGLFLACLFSGSLSTLSSSFNSIAAVIWEDFVIPLRPDLAKVKENQGICTFVPGLLAFLFGLICLALSFLAQNVEGVLNAAFHALSVFGGQAISVFFLGMFVRSANYKGVLAGKMTGDLVCLWLTIGSVKYSSIIVPPYLPIMSPHNTRSLGASNTSTNTCTALFNLDHAARDGIPSALNQTRVASTKITTLSSLNTDPGGYYSLHASAFIANKSRIRPLDRIRNNPVGPGLGNYILFKMYSISFLLISPLGFLICTVVGLLVSRLTHGIENEALKYDWKNLLHPWVVNDIPEDEDCHYCYSLKQDLVIPV